MPFERMAYAIDMFAATTDEEVVVQRDGLIMLTSM